LETSQGFRVVARRAQPWRSRGASSIIVSRLVDSQKGIELPFSPQNETFFSQKGEINMRSFFIFYKGHILEFLILTRTGKFVLFSLSPSSRDGVSPALLSPSLAKTITSH
jgi:hypothetical protein